MKYKSESNLSNIKFKNQNQIYQTSNLKIRIKYKSNIKFKNQNQIKYKSKSKLELNMN